VAKRNKNNSMKQHSTRRGKRAMTRIVGISGSPRTGGNTELLVKEALGAAAEENVQTEFISLAGKRIEPCDACGSCERARRCHIEDDFEAIYARVEDADGIIIGSPVYFGSATPQVKALIDRAGCIQGVRGDKFKGKVGGPIVVARRAGQNFALAQLLFFFLIMEMVVPGAKYWSVAFGNSRGDVVQDGEGIETVRDFGKKVAVLAKKLSG
jgi:multimeric flavodoxin WrbA